MDRKQLFGTCFFLIMSIALLAACKPQPVAVQPIPRTTTPALMLSPSLPVATSTSIPASTNTALPTKAQTTATHQPTYTQTSSSSLWHDAKVLSGGFLKNWEYLIIFQTKSKLNGSYHAIADANKPYQCEIRQAYPDRLYCWGRQVRNAGDASIVVYNDRDEIVFEGQFFTPAR